MANLSITAASVLASSTALVAYGTLGATVTQGQPLYKDSSDSNKLKLADANASAATAVVVGVSLTAGASGQPVKYAFQDDTFTTGGTMVVGETYVLSGTAGAFCPIADLTTGDRPAVCFVAITTTTAKLKINNGTAAKP